ncbi:nickel-type superoxide dismutase maturation protease [Streptomyces sp. TP-A0874]|uniref:nickel-type superoxide dismutase maturation protease n=1 Tax=Streptomyces sp. TP-A0874 TaxID=549819 RepID=UPI0009A01ACB
MPRAGHWPRFASGQGPGPDPDPDAPSAAVVPYGLAEVVGPSMVPTLRPGDRLLVRYGAPVRPGDVVVLRHPMQQDLLIVKRAVERRDGGWWVLGDNPYAESDSREFGAVPEEMVLARARLRLRPPTGLRAQRSLPALLAWALSAVCPVRSRRLRAR